ncbi:rhodanese-like domain-containing protein [Paenibacillus bovis]|uniref:Rhodanese n=1 Tax=Paenibacillus bovis TaxID=1616788 RepID=A0A172ZL81_9BACL|nr:rhodanese-like domain-containing protein [Paenibacillus bovis]ANF98338.1 rhodanese [Paenibacillus bovis]
MNTRPRFSSVTEIPAAAPEEAYRHFAMRLAYETDVADVAADLGKGVTSFILLDVRDEQSYTECHIPGAISLPGRRINEETTADWDREQTIITYCWGPACNGATRAASTLARLGFSVKEMIGGMEYWRKEGGAVEGSLGHDAPFYWQVPVRSE